MTTLKTAVWQTTLVLENPSEDSRCSFKIRNGMNLSHIKIHLCQLIILGLSQAPTIIGILNSCFDLPQVCLMESTPYVPLGTKTIGEPVWLTAP